jgi:iron complex transport system substrate-binding protein
VLLAAVAASFCAGPPAREAAPNAAPQRIVSLSPAITEILFALGVADRVVGVTDYCDAPPEARAKPKVGGYSSPSVEAVIASEPDLVIVSPGPGNRDPALALQRAGLRLEVVQAETIEESLAAIDRVARLCGVHERGLALAAEVRARLAAVAARSQGTPRVPAIFCVQIDPLIVAGAGTLPSELLEIAGGRNVIADPRYPRIGIESVIEAAPEVILQARMDGPGHGNGQLETEFWSRWPVIPAVRTGRVTILSDPVALRPGPRMGEAAEQLERLLHATPPVAGAPDLR